MAQLISPVCTDTLKLQNPSRTLCSRSRWRMLSRNTSLGWNPMGHGGKRRGFGKLRVATEDPAFSSAFADDYYAVLGLVILLRIFIFICFFWVRLWVCAFFFLFFFCCWFIHLWLECLINQLINYVFIQLNSFNWILR